MAAFVFRIGDTVYVDGKRYSWDEWKKIRDSEAMLGLKRSLGADTYEDLLSGLGTPENPFVVVPDHLQGEADRAVGALGRR